LLPSRPSALMLFASRPSDVAFIKAFVGTLSLEQKENEFRNSAECVEDNCTWTGLCCY